MSHEDLPSPPPEGKNLIEVLRRQAADRPHQRAYLFLEDGEVERESVTFVELDRRARALAAFLVEAGAAGERALLLYPPGLEFVTAFLGCLYAGVVAVPAYPPRANRPDARVQAIARDARPRFALSTRALHDRAAGLTSLNPALAGVRFLATEGIDPALAELWRPGPGLEPHDLAFLQYTSGSTANPKGVAIRHGNLIHNERMIQLAFRQSESSVVLGWLPLYHDMGLIGNVLQPLYVGATCVLMSPVAFLQRPGRWLRAISRYRATTSGGPNFAYELCLQKIGPEERPSLDLASWAVAYNGAEPVRAETLERFAAAFAPCGFRRTAFYPCYGLAEATLFVSGGAVGSAPAVRELDAQALERHQAAAPRPGASVRRLVSCGQPWLGQRVAIVDPESGRPCADGAVGEIWIAGPSVAGGYWEQPETTAATFGARLPELGDAPFLRTGDLGFLGGGELFLTGRIKDLIILRGRNLYPQDLERTAERSHPGLRPGCGAAFAVEEGGEERLVIVQEVERGLAQEPRELRAAMEAVRRAVAEEHEAALHAVVLVRAGAVPKTSSGKIRRQSCRADFLAGRIEPLDAWREGDADAATGAAPRTSTEQRLERIWADVLCRERVGVDQDLFALGADSLRATQLVSRVRQSFGVEVSLEELFAAPTIVELAAALDGPVPAARPTEDTLGSIPWPATLPLSFAQRRLWFLHQLEPDNPVHNLAASVRLTGRLAVPVLAAVFGEILRRHQALRTGFTSTGDEPVQVIHPPAPLPLPLADLSGLPPAVQEGEVRRAAGEISRRPFDLQRGPFLHLALLRLGQEEHELVLALHHIAADGGSLAVLVGELGALYGAFAAGRPSPLPELPVQYADYALWQRRCLDEAALAPGLAYWREQLAGELPALDLPADRPRPAVLSHRGAHHERLLPTALTDRLTALARAERATPFMALVAAFLGLLHRYTGQDDLIVGSPVAGRDRVELEGLIGVFLNNLVLRTRLSAEIGLRELIGRVRAGLLAGLAHQEVPFERLVDELRPERDLSRTPLFQVMIVGQNAPLRRLTLPGLTLEPREVDLGTARFDLALSLAETDHGWQGTWKYSTDLFDSPTVTRMATHLESLLAAALSETAGTAGPDRPLARLPLLTAAERHQVLAAWNDTAAAYPGTAGHLSLHERIAEQAARTPDAVALEAGAARRTYAELLAAAHGLATRLRRLGVGPESRVGIAAERSLEMMVGLLGTLLAGGAYVPLDPDYPALRLAYMLEDSGIDVLLTQKRLRDRLPAAAERLVAAGRALDLDDVDTLGSPAAPSPSLYEALPDNPAYVIYTSGSTGRPKGAVLSHRGIVNRLLWMQETYRLGPEDRVLQKTPTSFDVSVWELFWPLLVGARLVIAPPGAHQDPARLAGLIREHGITTLHFVPSLLQVFLEQPGLSGACTSLRRVFVSGEALPFELAERFLARLPGVALHNLYGPTEASVDVTFHACRPGGRRRTVPIGRPIANTSILLLDPALDPVPVGVPGELYIGGVNLARGYLGRPQLTAERFVPAPWGETPGGRLYRTGDLARFRPDGEVEFLGRLDHQVKVRGVRVELGEIEAALARLPGVREAVVLHTDARLVAYLVPATPATPATPEPAALRAALRQSLPEAMVPAVFVVLPAFPLTPSGKVDRKALPIPEAERPAGAATFTPPRTALEQRLAGIWQELLGLDRIGRNDNFFELGGDSIQGALFVNRLQRELGEIVYVMALFDAPTVTRFAEYLQQGYPVAAARLAGEAGPLAGATGAVEAAGAMAPGLGAVEVEADLGELRAAVARRLGRQPGEEIRTEPGEPRQGAAVVFLLSPFRSGSTLLRVMLAGHPRLFAPPELELLAFPTLRERRDAYSGRNRFAAEGLLRAVMELYGGDAETARRIVGAAEDEALPVGRFYGRLAERSGGRLLVDKTPSYALDLPTLRQAERLFDRPLYLHLTRHPRATVDSYVEAHMDRVYPGFPFAPEAQAERVWLLGHRNILEHLAGVPAERQLRLRFEDLVQAPRVAMEAICHFLGLGFEPAMLDPYEGSRMTDGLAAESRMMGDPKFHQHRGIEAAVADRWRAATGMLSATTRELAAALGYPVPAPQVEGLPPVPAAGLDLRPLPRTTELPLSFSQERLWFLSQLDPESPAYNMPAAVHLRGALDRSALAASFAEVRRRHEVLRTVFPDVEGRPAQRVTPPGPAEPLPLVDLGALPAAPRETERLRLALAEGRRPFDLARGPMLRTTLLRLGDREHVLLVTLHHVVSDGWTIGVLTRELGALYPAFAQGRPSPLPELPLQYADYAAGQRRWLGEAAMEEHLIYWRRRLAGDLPPLELPTDRPRPTVQTLAGARLSRLLPAAATDELRAWSARSGATLFLTLLAGWNALLSRYTGQDDLLLGIPIANRNRLEVEDLIGVFLNMVVQRTDASGDPELHTLLARVKEGFLGSIPHQEVPFEKLVLDLHPERDLSRAPIFQVQFSLQNTPTAPLALPGLTLELLPDHNRTTKFDVTVFLFDLPEGLTTTLEYNTDLFDEATIARLLAHWEVLLHGLVGHAGRRLSELPLLAASERTALLSGWNDPAAAFPAGPGLHRIFEEQAARRPGATAVVHDLDALSYRQLDERANRLAHRLRALGVGPETPVGLCVERSLDMVVGLLGILKAGGAYVPLDPAYPPERLAWILEDALRGVAAPVLVTQAHLVERFRPAGRELPFRPVALDADRAALAAESAERLPDLPGQGPDNLAYVIYTSGSTGRPKGVLIPHANAVRLFTATDRWFGFGAEDVWTIFHSYAFDFSVWEIWGALLHGGRLVVVPREVSLSAPAFYDLLATERVTVLDQTPSAFRQLVQLENEEGARPLRLRRVIFGGEALDLATLAPWIERHGDGRPALINMYGITETTVHVTYRPVQAADLGRPGASPVGVPIPDLQVHLLGRHMELLPVGIPGEIHVGGAGLARGYLGRPDLTAERFVPDPFSPRPGARLYRSGDLARRLRDGDLDYLGRIDGQVKIRGFRIELGEIESALSRHPGVRQAVVLSRTAAAGDPRLLAWVVAKGGPVAAAELREHLARSLPEYMVPAAFVHLDRLPLTAHGKVDRRALPEPEEVATGAGAAGPGRIAPRNRAEARVAEIWREVLRAEELGVEDSFFELGGHSLLATQVLSRVSTAFGVTLPLRALFETPTVAGLAAAVQALQGEDGRAAPPPLRPLSRNGEIPLSYAQERLWFIEQLARGGAGAGYSMPAAVRLRGTLQVEALAASLREIVRRHEALRSCFTATAGRPFQVIDPDWRPALPLVDLGGLPDRAAGPELKRRIAEEEVRPFDLASGPVLRSTLVRLAEGDYVLLFTLHHMVSDGWSLGILLRELTAIYDAWSRGEPSPLPELPVQYADFAIWQRQWLRGEVLEEQLGYWTRQLAGLAHLDLPVDRPPVAGQIFAAGDQPLVLEGSLAEGLYALARGQGASLFMVLLAAYQTLLHRHAGQDDVAVGSPIANRDQEETEGLIGFFVNTLVLRTHAGGNPSFRGLLGRVRETTLGAYDHQDLPFARVVEALRPDRGKGSWPLIDAMFTLQNQPMPAMELPGVKLDVVPHHEGTAFGITVAVSLRFWESKGRLTGGLGYNTARLDRTTAARWRGHLLALFTAAVANPELPIEELPLLGASERHQLWVEWSADGEVVRRGDRPVPIGVWGELESTGRRARRRADGGLEEPIAAAAAPGDSAEPAGLPAVSQSVAKQRADLASRQGALSAGKREMLEKRLRGLTPAGGTSTPRPVPPAKTAGNAEAGAPVLLVKLHAAPPGRPAFFCVHAVGGTVFSYAELARSMGPEQTFYGVQAAGLEGGTPVDDLTAMAAAYVAAVEAAEPGGPYLLGGWSFGGLVAFEMARQLRARGREVGLVALLDTWSPTVAETPAERGDAELVRLFLRDLAALEGKVPGWLDEPVPEGEEEGMNRLLARARQAGLLRADLRPGQVQRMLGVYQANLRALAGYRARPYAGRLAVFRPREAPDDPRLQPDNGWEPLTGEPIEVNVVPGNHYTMLAAPHVPLLARRLRHCIERALRMKEQEAGALR